MNSVFQLNQYYKLISRFYYGKNAIRSGQPYIKHIDDGLFILDAIDASVFAKQAYCIHPIVQDDKALANAMEVLTGQHDPFTLILAMEYRSVANDYISGKTIGSLKDIRLSPLPEVQQMLIADKIQNRYDFERFHLGIHERSSELSHYFNMWLIRLGVSESQYRSITSALDRPKAVA